MAGKPQEQRVCDEVPQSWAPGAPFLTWAPIGAPIGAPVCMSKWYEGQRKMAKMMADCRIFQKLFPEKGAVAKITLRHKADGPPWDAYANDPQSQPHEILHLCYLGTRVQNRHV